MTIQRAHMKLGRAVAVLMALTALGAAPASKSTKQGAAPGGKPQLAPMPKIPPYAKAQYDSVMSVNNQCPVRHGHLNPTIRPMYVNRQPVGFC